MIFLQRRGVVVAYAFYDIYLLVMCGGLLMQVNHAGNECCVRYRRLFVSLRATVNGG